MLRNVQLGKELVISVSNKIGVLADISKILADHGLNILAVAGYAEVNLPDAARIMVTCDDNLRAQDALRKSGYSNIKEREVVMVDVENKVGALKMITGKLSAEGIDIKYIYGTTCLGGCPSRVVFTTSDNEKAIVVFKK